MNFLHRIVQRTCVTVVIGLLVGILIGGDAFVMFLTDFIEFGLKIPLKYALTGLVTLIVLNFFSLFFEMKKVNE